MAFSPGGFYRMISLMLQEAGEWKQIWSLLDPWRSIFLEPKWRDIFLSVKQDNIKSVFNNAYVKTIRNFEYTGTWW